MYLLRHSSDLNHTTSLFCYSNLIAYINSLQYYLQCFRFCIN
nr:MAG TPA: hypothetical protein [Caudoviricetes sp.]